MLYSLNKNFNLKNFLFQLKTNKQYLNKFQKQNIFLTQIKEKNHKTLLLTLKKKKN